MSSIFDEGMCYSFADMDDGSVASGDPDMVGDFCSGSGSGTFSIVDIDGTRKYLSIGGGCNPQIKFSVPNGPARMRLAARVYRGDNSSYFGICGLLDTGANQRGIFIIGSDGKPGWRSGTWGMGSATYEADTAIPQGQWSFVEMEFLFNSSSGYCNFWVNGAAAGTNTSLNTGTYYLGSLVWLTSNGNNPYGCQAGWGISDLLYSPSGTAPFGDVAVFAESVDADTGDQDWTPSAGSDHYAMLDEVGPDGDTTTVSTAGTNAGYRDGFTTPGNLTVGTIISAGLMVRMKKSSTGQGLVKLGISHAGQSASEGQSGNRAVASDYFKLHHMEDLDPYTSAAWTAANMNAAEIAVEVGS